MAGRSSITDAWEDGITDAWEDGMPLEEASHSTLQEVVLANPSCISPTLRSREAGRFREDKGQNVGGRSKCGVTCRV